MRQDYTEALAALTTEVQQLAVELAALRERHDSRSAELSALKAEADDAAVWKAAPKARRVEAAGLPVSALVAVKDRYWHWHEKRQHRPVLLEHKLIRKVGGNLELTALGKAAAVYGRRGPEWCGMAGQLSGGAS